MRIVKAPPPANQSERSICILRTDRRNQIHKVVVELANVMDVAALAGGTVTAQVRCVDRRAGRIQRLGQRIHDATLRGCTMNEHRYLFSPAGIGAIGELCPISRLVMA
jgi:hypothetical protein